MIVARCRAELAEGLASLGAAGRRVGLVPTMGFLHEGHLSLVDLAKEHASAAAVSIFVNPTQFGPTEDLASYPRDADRDLALLEKRGADLVFMPPVSEVYVDGDPRITVDPGPLGGRLCGAKRPGHFRGVLTVVAKLFGLFQPDVAVFGRKDFQQIALIERMVRELDFRVRIVGGPIMREQDGLAMSSRNTYLSAQERKAAPAIQEGLAAAAARFDFGERRAWALIEEVQREMKEQSLLRLEYAEVVDRKTLEPVESVPTGAVLAVAAFCGKTRLIDNVTLE